jgi:hypothetical protein
MTGLNRDEELELQGLAGQAFELKDSPYLRDACEAILDWHDRRHVRRLEREQERAAALVRLLRATCPDSASRRSAA